MSNTLQPSYHAIANLGDVNPLEYGGAFVMVDRRGIYTPQLWVWDVDSNPIEEKGRLYRFDIPKCHILADSFAVGDNKHHPNHPAWYGDHDTLKSIASFGGMTVREFVGMLVHFNPIQRAQAFRLIAEHSGYENFDSYPLDGDKEVHKMVRRCKRQTVAAANWQDGLA
jgi:hypothetical protein